MLTPTEQSPAGGASDFLHYNRIFRRKALDTLDAARRDELGTNICNALNEQNAYKIKPLYFPLVLDQRAVDDMGAAALTIMSLQRRLLAILAKTHSRADLLDLFGIPGGVADLMNWDKLTAEREQISRFDVVWCADGQFRFCEINTDTSLGGSELYGFAKSVMDALQEGDRCGPSFVSPYADIALQLKAEVSAAQCDRIIILAFSHNYVEGYFDFTEFQGEIADACGTVSVHRCDERSYNREWLVPVNAARTVVYRFFSDEDMTDGGQLFNEIIRSGARVVNTFETYFYLSKKWFVLLHSPSLRTHMSLNELDVVARFIPKAVVVDPQNVDELIADKSRWVFKADLGDGGKAVIIGRDNSAERIREALVNRSRGYWTAQEFLDSPKIEVALDASWNVSPAYVVFGLYIAGKRVSGLNVRASRDSRVVNSCTGASTGWCVPLTRLPSE
jgi:hypothetical protein